MGLTGVYNDAVSEDVAISLIKHAFSKGITFFDTSDVYGAHVNEVLVGKVLLLLLLLQLNTHYIFIFV
jgi:aryl-alcohol dehydrogenase-like predicted oxidoreductase